MNDSGDTVGIVGYGEVGQAFARQLSASGFDVVVNNRTPSELRSRIDDDGPRVAESVTELATDSELVISCVWPQTAEAVADEMRAELAGTTYVDLNSIGPETTRAIDRIVTDAGGTFLKGAIMDSVAVHGADVPVILAGPDIETYAVALSDAGLTIDPFGTDVVRPAALKMCRSMVTKGILALFVETLLTARHYDLSEAVLDTVDESFRETTPAEFARYFLVDMADNAGRRRNELREVLGTARDARVRAPMAEATFEVHDAAAAESISPEVYADMLDALAPYFEGAAQVPE